MWTWHHVPDILPKKYEKSISYENFDPLHRFIFIVERHEKSCGFSLRIKKFRRIEKLRSPFCEFELSKNDRKKLPRKAQENVFKAFCKHVKILFVKIILKTFSSVLEHFSRRLLFYSKQLSSHKRHFQGPLNFATNLCGEKNVVHICV